MEDTKYYYGNDVSRTAPVVEAIEDGKSGKLVDFFNLEEIVQEIDRLLADAAARRSYGAAARRRVVERFDLRRICLPAQRRILAALAGGPARRSA